MVLLISGNISKADRNISLGRLYALKSRLIVSCSHIKEAMSFGFFILHPVALSGLDDNKENRT